jgi:hypothetical protein
MRDQRIGHTLNGREKENLNVPVECRIFGKKKKKKKK